MRASTIKQEKEIDYTMNNIKRFISILLASVLCLSMSTVSFAAEPESALSVNITESKEVSRGAGNVIGFGSASLPSGSGTFSVTLEESNWLADFTVAISGNNNGRYRITMEHEGKSCNLGEVYGNGFGTSLYQLAFASAGLYTFTVTNVNNSPGAVTAFVNIYD